MHEVVEAMADMQGDAFILGSGCEVPFMAKPENVIAMISAARAVQPGRP